MLSKGLLNEIENKSKELASLKPLSIENQNKLDKKIRLEFNYNSNHLEGNTLTYGETELLLIFDQTDGTHDYREYQEMEAHDVALRMITEEAKDIERPLTEQFIRSLNEHLLVKPFYKDAITQDGTEIRKQIIPGKYKTTPNSVLLANGEMFHYTAPSEVEKEMADLVAWYNEKEGKETPVLLAALVHYRFVRIHPFDDGNGRTARLLMNYILLKNNLPLVVIKSEAKKDYLAALNKADTGDTSAFVQYIGQQLLWSLDLSIKAAKGESIDEDDDLDKELELLKRDLKGLPNEFERKRSYGEINQLMNKSIVPLFIDLSSKILKIEELFVETVPFLTIKTYNKQHKNNNIYLLKDLQEENEITKHHFKNEMIEDAALNFYLTALKKSASMKNIKYILNVQLHEYHYIVYDDNQKKDLIKRPYGRFLTTSQINTIVKSVMGNIIEEIKLSTNIN